MGHLLQREKEKEREIEVEMESKKTEFWKSEERVRGIKMRNNNISPINTICRVLYVEKKMNAGKNKNKVATAHCKVCSDRLTKKKKGSHPKEELNLKKGILNALTNVFYSANYKVC